MDLCILDILEKEFLEGRKLIIESLLVKPKPNIYNDIKRYSDLSKALDEYEYFADHRTLKMFSEIMKYMFKRNWYFTKYEVDEELKDISLEFKIRSPENYILCIKDRNDFSHHVDSFNLTTIYVFFEWYRLNLEVQSLECRPFTIDITNSSKAYFLTDDLKYDNTWILLRNTIRNIMRISNGSSHVINDHVEYKLVPFEEYMKVRGLT